MAVTHAGYFTSRSLFSIIAKWTSQKITGNKFNHEQPEKEIQKFLDEYTHLKFLYKEGAKGSSLYYKKEDELACIKVPAYEFKDYEGLAVVDTTGAGDAFTGAFAVGLLELNGE